jgi:transporter family protein
MSSVFILLGKVDISSLSSIPLKAIFYLLLASILAGVFAQYLFYKALEVSSPSKVVIISSMYPLITILATCMISREIPSIKVVIGAILVFFGVFLVMD